MTRPFLPGLIIALGVLALGLLVAFTVGRYPVSLPELVDASLDFGNQGKVMREIRALAKAGHGVLFTTHDPNHALRAADRAYLLREGARIAEGAVGVVLTREQLEGALSGAGGEADRHGNGPCGILPG